MAEYGEAPVPEYLNFARRALSAARSGGRARAALLAAAAEAAATPEPQTTREGLAEAERVLGPLLDALAAEPRARRAATEMGRQLMTVLRCEPDARASLEEST